MILGRSLLGVTGILFAGYGLMCLFTPTLVGDYSGLEMPTASARAEAAAMYGGLQAGLGLFMLHCARRTSTVELGLLVLVTMVGSLALGRTIGMLIQGVSAYNLWALGYESITTLIGVVAIKSREDSGSEA